MGRKSGLDSSAFISAMKLAKPFLEVAALVDVHERAQRIAERARANAPVGTAEEEDPHPGAMRDDIGIKGEGIDRRGPYVDVGTREPYGLYVEFGTVNMPAQPFMRPALAAESGNGAMPTRVFLAPRLRKARRSR